MRTWAQQVQYNFVEHFYSDWCAHERYRLDHVSTEAADDADPVFLSHNFRNSYNTSSSPSPRDFATRTASAEGGGAPPPASARGGSGMLRGSIFGGEPAASTDDDVESLYLYP